MLKYLKKYNMEENKEQGTTPSPDLSKIRAVLAGDDFQVAPKKENDHPVDSEQKLQNQQDKTPTKGDLPENKPTFIYDPVWEQIRDEYEQQHGTGTFKKPDGITPETEKKALLDFLTKAIEPSFDDYPLEIKEQIELHKKGAYSPEQYFKQRLPENDYTKLSDEEFLIALFHQDLGKSENNPDGLSIEEIKEDISRMSKIQKKELARARREEILNKREQYQIAEANRIEQLREKQYDEINSKKSIMAQNVVNQHKHVKDFYGIEVSMEEKAQFDRDFLEMIKINKDTGTHKIAEMLNDDAVFYKTAYFLWKGEKGLKGYISDLKENVKKNIEEKLNPTLEEGRGSIKAASLVDRGKLI